MTDKKDDQDRESDTEAELYYGDYPEAMEALLDDLKYLGEAGRGHAAFGLPSKRISHNATAGRFVCATADTRARGPDLHVSDVGFVSPPLTQTSHEKLRRCCQQDDRPAQSENQAQTWQLNASTVADSNPGTSTVLPYEFCFAFAHDLRDC